MPNQFSKAREAGLEPGDEGYPESSNQFIKGTRREHPEEVRAKIRAGKIASILESIAEDPTKETSSRVAACKTLLDKVISNLSSVDQTIRDETDEMDAEGLEAKFMAIALSNPALLSRATAELARRDGSGPAKVGEVDPKAVNE